MKKAILMATAMMMSVPAMAASDMTHDNEKVKMKTEKFFSEADTNGDKMVSKSESEAYGDKMFMEADTDKNGSISMDEKMAKVKTEMEETKMMKK